MPDSPSTKYGKILFVFCGGGCKATHQRLRRQRWSMLASLHPTSTSSSAGTCNALGFVENPGPVGAEKTIRIWENYITSPESIYEVHPFLRDKLTRLLGVVPAATQDCGPSGFILHDVRRAIKFLPLVLSFCVRMPLRVAGRTSVSSFDSWIRSRPNTNRSGDLFKHRRFSKPSMRWINTLNSNG